MSNIRGATTALLISVLPFAPARGVVQNLPESVVFDYGRVNPHPQVIDGPCLISTMFLTPQPPLGKPIFVELLIDTSGHVRAQDMRIAAPYGSVLDGTLRDLFARTRFAPGRIDGQVVPVRWIVSVYFDRNIQADTALSICAPDNKAQLLGGPPPVYPYADKEAGIQGTVLIRGIIDTTGHVEPSSVVVVSTPSPRLATAALNMILASSYRPGRLHGRLVSTMVLQPVIYQLRKR